MNPEDLVDLPSDEDDEDAKWVTHYLFLSYNLC